jgi:enhancing lycopene biosynthesis protein 2
MSHHKTIGVVLAGSGVQDGSEIHEAVLTLLALDRAGVKIDIMAPDVPQRHVINHLSGEQMTAESRNVLREAARIARGKIRNLNTVTVSELDGLIFPGGYGAAKNLCDYALKGINFSVNPEVARIIRAMHAAKKVQGFICIAPVIAAKVLGEFKPELTIGNDPDTAADIEKLGGRHVPRKVDEIAEDRINKLISTPAYMLGPSIAPVAQGIDKLVSRVIELA